MATGTNKPVGSTDPRDLVANASNLDDAVNGDSKTFTDRFGRTRVSMKGVEEAVPDAIVARDQAQAAQAQAELARDASFVTGPKYPNEATGRAAVADGANFLVQGSGDVAAYEYRRVSAGTISTLIATYPSASAVLSPLNKSLVDSASGLLVSLPHVQKRGFFLNMAGVETANTNWAYSTTFLDVSGLSTVLFSGTSSVAAASVVFFDAAKTFISAATCSAAGTVVVADFKISVPANAKFARISGLKDEAYALKRGELVFTTRTAAAKMVSELGVNLLPLSKRIDGKAIVSNVVIEAANWYCTDYIAADPLVAYVTNMTSATGLANGIHCYDSPTGGNYLGNIPEPQAGVPFFVPSDCRSIRVNALKTLSAARESAMLCIGALPAEYMPNIKDLTVTPTRWSGKRWAAFGDSITDSEATPTTYPPIVAANLGLILSDYAKSGSRVRQSFIKATTAASVAGRHVVTIAHGTNDFKLETPLGTLADPATLNTTFYGDYKNVIETLQGWNPALRIALVTPIRRTAPAATGTDTNALGLKLFDYVNAVRALAAYYALPLLDLYDSSGFNALTMPTWTTDGLHPTADRQANVMASMVAGFIESL